MEDTEKNKEKLLSMLANPQAKNETPVEEKGKPTTSGKFANSPTPIKSLNLLFWILFLGVDIIIGLIIYIYWF